MKILEMLLFFIAGVIIAVVASPIAIERHGDGDGHDSLIVNVGLININPVNFNSTTAHYLPDTDEEEVEDEETP